METEKPESISTAIVNLSRTARLNFLSASAAPVLVGSALAAAGGYEFSWLLFGLALVSIMALHAGGNMANEFFDHLSGNDELNKNPTPYSGGSRTIQQGLVPPGRVLNGAVVVLAAGAAAGLAIVALTGSVFVLVIGIVGVVGAFCYTAPPIKLAYRSVGEVGIVILFGILPTIGAYYIQAYDFDVLVFMPAALMSILIFLIILINEFPDFDADAGANKNTLVVSLGKVMAARLYRAVVIASYILAAGMLAFDVTFYAAVGYMLTLPIAALAIHSMTPLEKFRKGNYKPSFYTILLHNIGTVAIAAGLLLAR